MKRHYPKLADWTVVCRLGGEKIKVINDLTNEAFETDQGQPYVDFITALDGESDPYELPSAFTRTERSLILRELSEHQLLRNGRWLNNTVREKSFALIVPRRKENASRFFTVVNKLLYTLFLPVFVCGTLLFQTGDVDIQGLSIAGLIVGILLGIVLHEAAHACAALSYGGKLYEAGVHLTFLLLPGAYILTSYEDHLAPQKQIQIYAAGIEMNAILAGVSFFLLSIRPQGGEFFFSTAWANFAMVMINLMVFAGSDGSWILAVLFGLGPKDQTIVGTAVDYVLDRSKRKYLFSRGTVGRVRFYAHCTVLLLQTAIPILMVVSVVEVISWFA